MWSHTAADRGRGACLEGQPLAPATFVEAMTPVTIAAGAGGGFLGALSGALPLVLPGAPYRGSKYDYAGKLFLSGT